METSKVQLDFKCPKSWDSMTPKGNGRFCGDCKKVVKDYSRLEIKALNITVSSNTDEKQCGSFYAYQLNKPFGNWKDKIVSYYQSVSIKVNSVNLLKPVTVFLLFLVILITGCARRLSGRYAPHHDSQTSKTNTK